MHKDKFALDIVILTSGKVHAVDKNVGKLIKFYGLNVDIVLVNTYHDIINCLRYFSCLMINVASCGPVFSDIFEQYRLYSDQSLDSKIIFLYNISSGLACFKALQHLTFEVFNAATAFDMNNYEYNITKEFPDICRQFSGLQFGPINKDINFGLLSSKEQKVIKIIKRGFRRVAFNDCYF